MSAFEQLKQLIDSKKLSIKIQLSIPRSNSNAVEVALCQRPGTWQVNEPDFNHNLASVTHNFENNLVEQEKDIRTVEQTCQRVLDRYNAIDQNRRAEPVTLIVKLMTQYSTASDLEKMLQLTDSVLSTIRHPRIFAYSALARVVNEVFDEMGGSHISPQKALTLVNHHADFTQEEIQALLGPGKDKINPQHFIQKYNLESPADITSAHLKHGFSEVIATLNNYFLKDCWHNLNYYLPLIESLNKKIAVINGVDLLENPFDMMKKVCVFYGFKFNESMVNDWKNSTGENYYCCISRHYYGSGTDDYGAWNHGTVNSKRLSSKSTSSLPSLDAFPPALKHGILAAEKIYNSIIKKPYYMSPGKIESTPQFKMFSQQASESQVRCKPVTSGRVRLNP